MILGGMRMKIGPTSFTFPTQHKTNNTQGDHLLNNKFNNRINKSSGDILEKALNDEIKKKHELNVVFVDVNKRPGIKWKTWQRKQQTDADLKRMFRAGRDTGYAYVCGFNNLVELDFDWYWVYAQAIKDKKLSKRLNSRTISTPSGGMRCLFFSEEEVNGQPFKEKLKTEIHGSGSYVIVEGSVKNDSRQVKKYEVVNDDDILTDHKIVSDFKEFLDKIYSQYEFLQYPCIKNKLQGKVNELEGTVGHQQRLHIGNFCFQTGMPFEVAVEFCRIYRDFEENETKKQLESIRKKIQEGLKPPKCETLQKDFNWDKKQCGRCPRKKPNEQKTNNESTYRIDYNEFLKNPPSKDKVLQKPLFYEDGILGYSLNIGNMPEDITEGARNVKISGVLSSPSYIGESPLPFYLKSEDPRGVGKEEYIPHPHMSVDPVTDFQDENQYIRLVENIERGLSEHQITRKGNYELFNGGAVYSLPLLTSKIKDVPKIIEEYIKLENSIEYIVGSCWILGTYMFPIFNQFPYFIVRGEKGSGKGTFLDILYLTCWNTTKKLVATTTSPIFRIIEGQHPTLIIDEYHRMVKSQSSENAVVSILEAGIEANSVVYRTSEDSDRKPEAFGVFCPKALATRETVEAEDKAITLIMPKTGSLRYARRKNQINREPFFEDIKRYLPIWTLNKYQEIQKNYKEIEPQKELTGRDFSLWLPILSICKVAYPEKYEEVLKYAEDHSQKKHDENVENEDILIEGLYLMYLSEELQDASDKNNELLRVSLKSMSRETDLHWKSVQACIKNLRLQHKIQTVSEGKVYYLKKTRLIELFEDRGLELKEVNKPKIMDFKEDIESEEEELRDWDEMQRETLKKTINHPLDKQIISTIQKMEKNRETPTITSTSKSVLPFADEDEKIKKRIEVMIKIKKLSINEKGVLKVNPNPAPLYS